MTIDPRLLEYATPTQRVQLEAVIKMGSIRGGARESGVHHSTIQSNIEVVRRKAALAGYAPEHDMTKTAPDTHFVKGVSSYYNREGQLAGQWVKTDISRDEQMRRMLSVIEAACDGITALPKTPKPSQTFADLCALYTITDAHIGMYASEKEGGANWDLEIAERDLVGCFSYLVDASPKADTAIIAQLGDLLHYDGLDAVTPTSRHILDASGRFHEMAHVAVRVLRRMVEKALLKHRKVIIIMAEGNHDMASSVWLRIMFKALYENEPRVQIVDNEIPYYAYQHGNVMLGWHHSHLKKMDQLPLMMAAQFAKIWGDTTMRYFHTGDQHHSHEKEYSGAIVTQHPTLAAKDAYAARHGWHALRTATALVYHKEHGRVSSVSASPDMLQH